MTMPRKTFFEALHAMFAKPVKYEYVFVAGVAEKDAATGQTCWEFRTPQLGRGWEPWERPNDKNVMIWRRKL